MTQDTDPKPLRPWNPPRFKCARCGEMFLETLKLYQHQERHERDRRRDERSTAREWASV